MPFHRAMKFSLWTTVLKVDNIPEELEIDKKHQNETIKRNNNT